MLGKQWSEDVEDGVHRPHEVRAARIGGGIALTLSNEVRQLDVGLHVVIVNLRVALQREQERQPHAGKQVGHGAVQGRGAQARDELLVETLVEEGAGSVVKHGGFRETNELARVRERTVARRSRLDGGTREVQVAHEIFVRGRDEDAAVRDALDDALRRQHGKGLPQGVAGAVEALGRADLIELLAGHVLALGDGGAQRGGDGICKHATYSSLPPS